MLYQKIPIFSIIISLGILGYGLFFELSNLLIILLVGTTFAGFSITIWGVFCIQSQYFIKTQCKLEGLASKKIMLTFDDGPHPNTLIILRILKKYNIKALFFCIGKEIEKYPEIVQEIIAQGHEIGNHTYSHKANTPFMTTQELTTEIIKTDTVIAQYLGRNPLYFRPPFGITSPVYKRVFKKFPHQIIGWNIRSLDTQIKTTDALVSRVNKQLKTNAILLLHDNRNVTMEALEAIIIQILKKKYTFVVLN